MTTTTSTSILSTHPNTFTAPSSNHNVVFLSHKGNPACCPTGKNRKYLKQRIAHQASSPPVIFLPAPPAIPDDLQIPHFFYQPPAPKRAWADVPTIPIAPIEPPPEQSQAPEVPTEPAAPKKPTWAELLRPVAGIVVTHPQPIEYCGPIISPRGIVNSGNMCYMNVILQPLIHSPPFRNIVMQASLGSSKIMHAVRTLVSDYVFRDGKILVAEPVYEALAAPFVKGSQEDAHEFLGYLLQGLHSEYKQPKSPITHLFTGTMKSILRIPSALDSITTHAFECMPVDISKAHSVREAVDLMMRPEIVREYPAAGVVTKQTVVEQCPPIVVLQLNRFMFASGQTVKSKKHVEVTQVLHFNHAAYKLFAVVNHHGRVANGGHYTCDVVSNPSTGTWIRMDDLELSVVDVSAVVEYKSDREPYLLFYECAKTIKRIIQPIDLPLSISSTPSASPPPSPPPEVVAEPVFVPVVRSHQKKTKFSRV